MIINKKKDLYLMYLNNSINNYNYYLKKYPLNINLNNPIIEKFNKKEFLLNIKNTKKDLLNNIFDIKQKLNNINNDIKFKSFNIPYIKKYHSIEREKDLNNYEFINKKQLINLSLNNVLKILYIQKKISKSQYKKSLNILNLNTNIKIFQKLAKKYLLCLFNQKIEFDLIINLKIEKLKNNVLKYINSFYQNIKAKSSKNNLLALNRIYNKNKTFIEINLKGYKYQITLKKYVYNRINHLNYLMVNNSLNSIHINNIDFKTKNYNIVLSNDIINKRLLDLNLSINKECLNRFNNYNKYIVNINLNN